jgi:TP901 family phage tail tape measure protein
VSKTEGTNVGTIVAKITADLTGYNAGVDKATAKAKELGKSGQDAGASFAKLNSALTEVGASSAQIAKIQKALRDANPEILRKQIAEVATEMRKLGATHADIAKVTAELERTATGGSKVTAEMKRLSVAYLAVAAAMTGIAIKAVETAAEFEQSLANLRAITQATDAEFERLRQNAFDLGATTVYSASQASDAMTELAQSGFNTNEIISAMPGLLALAASSQTDLATTADITSSALRGFGLAADQSGRVADVLAKSAIDTNANVLDLGMAMKFVAPVASAMGLSIEETTATIGELSNAGIKGEMAGTQLRAILLALASPSKEAAGYMDKLGVTIADSTGKVRPLNEIVGQLSGAFTRLTQAQQADVAATLVGREAASGFITLINNGADTLNTYTDSLENAGGTAERVAKTQLDTFKGAVEELKSALEGVGIEIGDTLIPAVRGVAEFLTRLLSGFTQLNPEVKAAATVFVVVTAAVLGLAGAIGALTIAMTAIGAPLGLIALIAVELGLVAAQLTSNATKSREAAEAVKRHTEAQRDLNDVLSKAGVTRSTAELEELRQKHEDTAKILERRAELEAQIVDLSKQQAKESSFLASLNPFNPSKVADYEKALFNTKEEVKALDGQLKDLGWDNADQATSEVGRFTEEVNKSTVALYAEKSAEVEDVIAKNRKITQMETLMKRYTELSAAKSLDQAQTAELNSTVETLKDAYPQLTYAVDANGRARISNVEIIENQMTTERRQVDEARAGMVRFIEGLREQTKAQKTQIEAQIANYRQLLYTMGLVADVNRATFGDLAQKADAKNPFGLEYGNNATKAASSMIAKEAKAQADVAQGALDQANKALLELDNGIARLNDGGGLPGIDLTDPDKKRPKAAGKTPEEIAAELRKKNYDAALRDVRYMAEMYEWSADKQIAEYKRVADANKRHLAETVEDRQQLDLQLKRLAEDSAKSRYEFSATWIEREQKTLEDAGKSDVDRATRQLELWTKVRGRYKAGSDEYIAADDKVRESRKSLATATETAQKDAYDARVKLIDREVRRMEDAGKSEAEVATYKAAEWAKLVQEYAGNAALYEKADEALFNARKTLADKTKALAESLVKTQKAAINDAKKTELAAIDERKKAALSDYDARIDAIQRLRDANKQLNADADYETQLAEKNARIALLASAVGPDGIAEREALIKERDRMILDHQRDLTDRSLEAQQDALKTEQEAKADGYDRDKTAATAHYDALISAFDDYSGDIKTIESAIAAFRITETGRANATILTEMDVFVRDYNAKMSQLSQAADVARYAANGAAWNAAKAVGDKAEMARATAENDALRKKYGMTKDIGYLQTFSAGGIVQGTPGQAVMAQVHSGEIVLNPQQQTALFEALARPAVNARSGVGPVSPVTNIVNNIDMSVNDVEVTGKADAATIYDERLRAVSRIQATGGKTG